MDLSYIAGFFDGEGSISVTVGKPRGKKELHSLSLVIVAAYNTDIEVLREIAQELKAFDIETKLYLNKPNGRLNGCLRLDANKDRFNFLSLMLPYLRVRRKAAMLAKQYLESRILYNDYPGLPLRNEEQVLLLQLSELTCHK